MATSRRARAHAGRVIAGSGAVEPGPGRGRGPRHLPNFVNPGLHIGQRGPNSGYTGIAGILAALQGGMNANQFGNLQEGHTGGHGWGGIGGQKGAFSGISPYAAHFLSSLMEKKAADHTDVTGLAGDDLWKATLMNNLADQNAAANPSYQLHSGVDEDFIRSIFQGGFAGHGAYEQGANATGSTAGRPGAPWMPHQRSGMVNHGQMGQRMGQGHSNINDRFRRRPFRPGGVVRRPLR